MIPLCEVLSLSAVLSESNGIWVTRAQVLVIERSSAGSIDFVLIRQYHILVNLTGCHLRNAVPMNLSAGYRLADGLKYRSLSSSMPLTACN